MKKQLVAVTMALLVLLSMTAFAANNGRYDQEIQQAVSQKMHRSKQLKNVDSSVEDGVVTLTGPVNLYQDKLDAAKKAKKIANVAGIRNDIEVAGANVPDNQLEQKLAKKLAFDRVGYFDNTFNYLALTVENGVVTLRGDTMYDAPKDSAMAIVAREKKGPLRRKHGKPIMAARIEAVPTPARIPSRGGMPHLTNRRLDV